MATCACDDWAHSAWWHVDAAEPWRKDNWTRTGFTASRDTGTAVWWSRSAALPCCNAARAQDVVKRRVDTRACMPWGLRRCVWCVCLSGGIARRRAFLPSSGALLQATRQLERRTGEPTPDVRIQAVENAKSHGSRLRRGAALPSNPRARWVTQGRQRRSLKTPGQQLFFLTGKSSRRSAFSAAWVRM